MPKNLHINKAKVSQIVKQYLSSSFANSQSKFDEIVEKLDFENRKLQEKVISEQVQKQVRRS